MRRALHDWLPLYLFSFDVELRIATERIGQMAAGFRMNLHARAETSRVYDVARAASAAGRSRSTISGRLRWASEELLLRNDDVGVSQIRASIVTDAGTLIDLTYAVVTPLGPGVARRIIGGPRRDLVGTEDRPVEAPVTIFPRFLVADPALSWLNECQGIGFGRLQIVRSEPRHLTCDIYALS